MPIMVRNSLMAVLVSLAILGCKGPKPVSPEIFTAIRNNNLEDVKRFVAHGWKLETPTDNGTTALHMAVNLDRYEIAEFLLKSGALVDARDQAGLTALNRAAYAGNIRMAELMLNHKADINFGDIHMKTPLLWAARRNQMAMVKFLISKGADVKAETDHNESAAELAEQMGHTEVAAHLRALGAR